MRTKATREFRLGTAVKLTVLLDVANPTSVTISIQDPKDTYKVTNATMSQDADTIYSYVYQSATTDDDGDYIATITVTSGGYITKVQDYFTLLELDGT